LVEGGNGIPSVLGPRRSRQEPNLASVRLPLAFTVLFFAVIELALLLVFLGTSQASTGLLRAGGWAVFAFVIVGAYLFVDAMNAATGGKRRPLERPVVH
jgi:hypothetical protein